MTGHYIDQTVTQPPKQATVTPLPLYLYNPYVQKSINFPKIWEPPPKFRRQIGDNCPILRTRIYGVTCEPHCYLLLSVRCVSADTHLCIQGKNDINFGENIRRYHTKYSRAGASTRTPVLGTPTDIRIHS